MSFVKVRGERSRTYLFPSGHVTINNVKRLCVRHSGTHRLETEAGEKFIVQPGWMAIQIDADEWSF
jgi:hypothetical protein